MAYGRQLSPAQEHRLAPILAQRERIQPGRTMTIEDTPENISLIRYDLYTYFHLTGVKAYYRITSENPTTIRILRRAGFNPKISVEEDEATRFVSDQLLDCDTEELALERIRNSKLTAAK